MSKNTKIVLFFVLLLAAGGGLWCQQHQESRKPSIVLSNANHQDKTVKFKMSYEGQQVEGVAYKGHVYLKQKGETAFMYGPVLKTGTVSPGIAYQNNSTLRFSIMTIQGDLMDEKTFTFNA